MKILYIAATSAEAEILEKPGSSSGQVISRHGRLRIFPLTAGVGSISTMWNIAHWIRENGKPDLAINGGIAGSFNQDLKIGDVVMPVSECFADLGIEDNERFTTLFEAGLARPDDFPFEGGYIRADVKIAGQFSTMLRSVTSITVNTASGSHTTIERLRTKYNADIETMEGASFFYICRREGIPFLAVRSISNLVEPRNRNNWNIRLALDNLAAKLDEVFLTMEINR